MSCLTIVVLVQVASIALMIFKQKAKPFCLMLSSFCTAAITTYAVCDFIGNCLSQQAQNLLVDNLQTEFTSWPETMAPTVNLSTAICSIMWIFLSKFRVCHANDSGPLLTVDRPRQVRSQVTLWLGLGISTSLPIRIRPGNWRAGLGCRKTTLLQQLSVCEIVSFLFPV